LQAFVYDCSEKPPDLSNRTGAGDACRRKIWRGKHSVETAEKVAS